MKDVLLLTELNDFPKTRWSYANKVGIFIEVCRESCRLHYHTLYFNEPAENFCLAVRYGAISKNALG